MYNRGREVGMGDWWVDGCSAYCFAFFFLSPPFLSPNKLPLFLSRWLSLSYVCLKRVGKVGEKKEISERKGGK